MGGEKKKTSNMYVKINPKHTLINQQKSFFIYFYEHFLAQQYTKEMNEYVRFVILKTKSLI